MEPRRAPAPPSALVLPAARSAGRSAGPSLVGGGVRCPRAPRFRVGCARQAGPAPARGARAGPLGRARTPSRRGLPPPGPAPPPRGRPPRPEPRQWILLGLWGGLGLESKYTIVVPLAAFLTGCALWRRDLLLRREAAIGVVIAVGLLIPSVAWQITHHCISLDFASSQHDKTASDSPPVVYAGQMLAFLGAGAVLAGRPRFALAAPPPPPLPLPPSAPPFFFGLEERLLLRFPPLGSPLPPGLPGAVCERARGCLARPGLAHVAVLAAPLVVRFCPSASRSGRDRSFGRARTPETGSPWGSRTPAERARSVVRTPAR